MLSGIGVRFASQPRATAAEWKLPATRSLRSPRPDRERLDLVAGCWLLVAGCCERSSLGHIAQLGGFFAEAGQGVPFDLADPFAAQLEFVGDFFEGPRASVVESET